MASALTKPRRGAGVRALGLPLPPERMPLWRGGRVLKRWRYVGVYTPELMLCAGHAWVGPLSRRWWAVAEPDGVLHQGSSGTRRGVAVGAAAVVVRAPDVRIALRLGEADAVEVASPAGDGSYIWTAKRSGVPVRGSVVVQGRAREIDGPNGFVDESAGYHPRRTEWRWSAGLGATEGGQRVGWNLVSGIHDAPENSERTLWIDGESHEPGPVRFAADLSQVEFAEGGRLRFTEWAAVAERTNLLVLRNTYRQPFGAFTGRLPGGLRLRAGYGVMEHHEVLW